MWRRYRRTGSMTSPCSCRPTKRAGSGSIRSGRILPWPARKGAAIRQYTRIETGKLSDYDGVLAVFDETHLDVSKLRPYA